MTEYDFLLFLRVLSINLLNHFLHSLFNFNYRVGPISIPACCDWSAKITSRRNVSRTSQKKKRKPFTLFVRKLENLQAFSRNLNTPFQEGKTWAESILRRIKRRRAKRVKRNRKKKMLSGRYRQCQKVEGTILLKMLLIVLVNMLL